MILLIDSFKSLNTNPNPLNPNEKPFQKNKQQVDSESEEDEDDQEANDIIPILPEKLKNAPIQRPSVSAEVYGLWNKKGVYKPKIIPKSTQQKDRIRKRLNQSFIFQALDDNEKNIVIDAMDERSFKLTLIYLYCFFT